MKIKYHEIKDLEINNTWERCAYRSSDINCFKFIINNTQNIFLSYNAPLGSIFFGTSCYMNLKKILRKWCDLRTKYQDRIIKKYFPVFTHYGSASHMFDMIFPMSKENMVKEYFEAQLKYTGDLSIIKFYQDQISEKQKELLSIFDPPHAEKLYEVVHDLENYNPNEFSDLLIKDRNMWIRLFLNVQLGLDPPLPPLKSLGNLESETESFFDQKLVKGSAYVAALINLLDWPKFYNKVELILENCNWNVTAPKTDGSVYSYREELTRYKKTMEERYPFLLMEFD